MPIVEEQVRNDAIQMWQRVEYDAKDQMIRVFWIRVVNRTTVTLEMKVTTSRGDNMVQRAVRVTPGQDRTYPQSGNAVEEQFFPIVTRGIDWGISVGQL